jgi:integrase
MNPNIRFKTPKLYDAKGDIKKDWYVYYSFFNSSSKKLERLKIKAGINKEKTVDARRIAAGLVITKLTEDLLNGYNPFDKPLIRGSVLSETYYLSNILMNYFIKKKEILRKKTISTYSTKIEYFCAWLKKNYPGIEVKDFTEKTAREFIEFVKKEKKSNTTINSYFITLKTLFNEMWKDDLFLKNPFSKIKRYPEVRQGKLPFKEYHKEVLKKQLQEKNQQLWLFVQFIYYCFIRPGELRLLKVEAINVDNSTIVIDAGISKNKKTQYVAIPKPLLNIIKEKNLNTYPDNYFIFGRDGLPGPEPRKDDYFNRAHKEITDFMGLGRRYTLYSWKSTGAVDAVRSGLGLKDIQLQLRHSSLEMTDIYLQSIGVLDNKAIMNNFPEL